MTHLLLVEDDSSLGSTLSGRLEAEGFFVSLVQTCEQAQAYLKKGCPDIALLDIGLPDGSGFEIAKKLKKKNCPIVFLTARHDAETRLNGYEIGADDYIPKPFHLKELLLRLQRVLKQVPSKNTYSFPNFSIHPDLNTIELANGEHIKIGQRDFRILLQLIENNPVAVSRDDFLKKICKNNRDTTHRTIDNSIVRLRKFLEPLSERNPIESVRGVGYRWTLNQG